MRRSNKGTYFIIALICLILLNIGSLIIQFNRNYVLSSNRYKDNIITKFFRNGSIKELIRDVFNIDDELPNINDLEDNDDAKENSEKHMEDFIIIETLEEYENLIIVKDSKGKGSMANIPEPLNIKKPQVDSSKPYVFIYHTHATEGYKPFETDSYYTTNNEKNVVKIGDTVSKVLEANEHKVIHETKHHDRPSYNQSYSRSLNTLNQAKEKENNLTFFFDIHRDGVDENASYYEKFKENSKIEIHGKDVATFSLVVGPNTPNYDQVLSFAKYIKAVSDTLYPGLCTGIIVKPYGKYNLYISDYAALIEIGSNINTMDEANECAKLVGEILDLVINSIKE